MRKIIVTIAIVSCCFASCTEATKKDVTAKNADTAVLKDKEATDGDH